MASSIRRKASGGLHHFNRAFRERRRAAAATGVVFPVYAKMPARYRAALAASIVGNVAPDEVMGRVFDG
jgi:hypothetical protein